jgi:hypothetical protein
LALQIIFALGDGCCKKTEQEFKHRCGLSEENLWINGVCPAKVSAPAFGLIRQRSWSSPEAEEIWKKRMLQENV